MTLVVGEFFRFVFACCLPFMIPHYLHLRSIITVVKKKKKTAKIELNGRHVV